MSGFNNKIFSVLFASAFSLFAFSVMLTRPVWGQLLVTSAGESILDNNALLMPSNAIYGRAINGNSFQTEALMTYGNYQYASWYHLSSSNEEVYLARRELGSTSWQVMNTGGLLINGDATPVISSAWDAHNVISMGISNDGVIHLSYDHHGNTLRYVTSSVGAATGATWNSSVFNAERSSLNVGGSTITNITYPQFVRAPNGNMLMAYRTGSSGNGNTQIATYNSTTQTWNAPRVILGSTGSYTDALGTSNTRNAYVNGFDYGTDGSLHVSFTWREDAGGANHDIGYITSTDGGNTWKNSAGQGLGATVQYSSPGIHIATMDRRNTLMNQQGQAVDLQGGVHVLMWHRRFDEPGFQYQSGDPVFYTNDAAHYHYYRDPVSGAWTRQQLPTEAAVGSRGKIAYDAQGNVYAVYTSPDAIPTSGNTYYANGNLIVAGATKASGYSDWSILYEDTRLFSGEPLIDQQLFLDTGVLSVYLQQAKPGTTGVTGSNLYVLNFAAQAVPEPVGIGLVAVALVSACFRRNRNPKCGTV